MVAYAFPPGGLPDQSVHPGRRAIFTDSYALIPAETQRDITTSFLPGWTGTRVWILARPLSGFAETFAQYAVELTPEGGSNDPEPETEAQAILFVAYGTAHLTLGSVLHVLTPGSYAYIPPGVQWSLFNRTDALCGVHWIRKRYVRAGDDPPDPLVTHEADVPAVPMPDAPKWATQRFLDPLNLRYDCHVNIVNFDPGGRIPFAETHVMEHGLYVLEGSARYLLNQDWHSVGAGDFMWLRAFCPQACIAQTRFRYLLYKDVNRHVPL
ncbi:MAG: bifunctional allantoicase/(S)-ureidoglycine aminohydrolase [Pseudomonadota bacterium]